MFGKTGMDLDWTWMEIGLLDPGDLGLDFGDFCWIFVIFYWILVINPRRQKVVMTMGC